MGWSEKDCAAANNNLKTMEKTLGEVEGLPNSHNKAELLAVLRKGIKMLGEEIGENCRSMTPPPGAGPSH